MRFRLGGCAVALALLLGACGSDTGSDSAATGEGDEGDLPMAELVSSRDTLPPVPSSTSTSTVTIVLTHPGGAGDPGLDAAAAALAQRPDLHVVVVAPTVSGEQDPGDSTMSGFPVTSRPGGTSDAVASALADTTTPVDLVIVGIGAGHGIGARESAADVAVAHGVPALVVGVEDGDVVDYAAATLQMLEVLDLELDGLLSSPASVHRLAVPSCTHGMLRGRVTAAASADPDPALASDCTGADHGEAPDGSPEATAFAAGWATLSRVP